MADPHTGPSCNDVCLSVGLLAGRWGLPLVSYGCESDVLLDKTKYPTFLSSTGSFTEMSSFLEETMRHFGWTHVTLVSSTESVWVEAIAKLEVRAYANHPNCWSEFNNEIDKSKSILMLYSVPLLYGYRSIYH